MKIILEIDDKMLERVVGEFALIAEDFSSLMWDAIEEHAEYDEDDTIGEAWWKAVETERVDSEYFEESKHDEAIFEHCLVLLRELNLVTNNGFVQIMDRFRDFMSYPADESSVDKWRKKLKESIIKCITNKEVNNG